MTSETNVLIEGGNLTANKPAKSHRDFSFSFYVIASGLDAAATAKALQKALPAFSCRPSNNPDFLSVAVSDKDCPGICKHLVKLFQTANAGIAGLSASPAEGVLLERSPAPQNLPAALKDHRSFKTLIDNSAVLRP